MKDELAADLAPFLDERGRPEEAYRGSIRRIEVRFQRRERRAERDYVDWVLLAVSALLRDAVAAEVGGGLEVLLNPDLAGERAASRAARASPSCERPVAWRPSRRRAPPSRRTSISTPVSCWNGRSSGSERPPRSASAERRAGDTKSGAGITGASSLRWHAGTGGTALMDVPKERAKGREGPHRGRPGAVPDGRPDGRGGHGRLRGRG